MAIGPSGSSSHRSARAAGAPAGSGAADPGAGGTFTWLDQRNASLALLSGSAALPVRVLLEMRERGELAVLVTSREGMTRGAPLSHAVLEQMLLQLQKLLPQAALQSRSDRDGPVEHPAGAR